MNVLEDIKHEDIIDIKKNDEFQIRDIDMIEDMFDTLFVIDNKSIKNYKFGKTTLIPVIKTNVTRKQLLDFKKLKIKELYSDLYFETDWLSENKLSINDIEFNIYEMKFIDNNKDKITKNYYNFKEKYNEKVIPINYLENKTIFDENDCQKIKAYSIKNNENNYLRLKKLLEKIGLNAQNTRISYVKRFEKIISLVNLDKSLNLKEKNY